MGGGWITAFLDLLGMVGRGRPRRRAAFALPVCRRAALHLPVRRRAVFTLPVCRRREF